MIDPRHVRRLKDRDVESLRQEIQRRAAASSPVARLKDDPEGVQRSLARLVLALIEFLRRLMERQAIRRMEQGSLTPEQVEALGQGLMKLETTVHELAAHFGIAPEELNLDLGPLGRLL